jgi:CRP/FNR family transcriptional regulator, cyclic AMP receptor protein
LNNPLWSYIFNQNKSSNTLIATLSKQPIFEKLTQKELRFIEKMMHIRQYKKEELIFKQGEPGAALYIIQKGEIKIYLEENDTHLATILEGHFFGEIALLDNSPRTASASAQKETTLLVISNVDLDVISERNPKLGLKIVRSIGKLLAQRLSFANEQLIQKA